MRSEVERVAGFRQEMESYRNQPVYRVDRARRQPGRQPRPALSCVVRMARDRRTMQYVARRIAEGKSRREIVRCLKRCMARKVYRVLVSAVPPSPNG